MHDYIAISFENLSLLQKEILIAQLSEIGFEGFEEGTDWLSAFIKQEDYDENSLTDLLSDPSIVFNKKLVPQQNWNSEWEKNFEPVLLDDFCVIRAAFHKPRADVQHDIVITPKMSFGTGHHATTYMMLQFMRTIDFHHKKVLDFGTGTGVLAILAEQMGADYVCAIDNDDWSIRNAEENFEINHCTNVRLQKADSILEENLYDIILANINKNVLLANMASIQQHLQVGGVVIMSGLLKGDETRITTEALRYQLGVIEQIARKDWISLKMALNLVNE